ncbi:META domain-containing protein [Corynebacterium sp. FDAARGOS 1242]|uniref:META domain-containing protein n=1 Tax=Corynebacterium sp. FDAARGOS 1242 TaxID=2778078 RepID=UPI00195147F6|nr:META domain-containing protein [Corynebacterium sp. FDAARGOS 1242]QRP98402.1 META domain-containing protein [Corynebacterium sp. FDAARGOS 1242]
MLTHTFKKATIATAFAALTCGALGTGVAGAVESAPTNPFASSSSQFAQLSSKIFGGQDDEKGSGVVEKIDDVEGLKAPLSADEANKVLLDGPFEAKKNKNITIGFQEDGTVAVDDGCNGGSGTYAVDEKNGTVELKDVMTTKKGCEKSVMEDAKAFTDLVYAKPHVYTIDDSTIAFVTQGHVIQFVKAAEEIK